MRFQFDSSEVLATLKLLLDSCLLGFHTSLESLASRPRLTITLAGAVTMLGAACLGLAVGTPLPSVHDEFSYLLQADTFASGRLTNPTPTLWQHFETFHVILNPTYASKYPPGQGLFLALGQIVGHPIIGVWISVSLMVAAISWMLFAWVPARWAVVTTLVVIVHIGIGSYWAQSYWGGAVAATGGALVYGALRRLADEQSLVQSVVLGIGFCLLALTRPFEGLIISLPAVAVMAHRFWKTDDSKTEFAMRGLAPAVLLVVMTVGFIGYYNWRVTGNPANFPYAVHQGQYSITTGFLWSEPQQPPEYRHSTIERYYRVWGKQRTELYENPVDLIQLSAFKALRNMVFMLGPGLIVLLYLKRAATDSWILFGALVAAGLLLTSLTTAGSYPHYAAPATGLLFAVMGACLAAMHSAASDRAAGVRRTALILLMFCFYALSGFDPFPTNEEFAARRSQVRQVLLEKPGSDLVFVRYGPGHDFHNEWVYNSANIEDAPIIWARHMEPEENVRLAQEYDGRKVWVLRVGGSGAELKKFQSNVSG